MGYALVVHVLQAHDHAPAKEFCCGACTRHWAFAQSFSSESQQVESQSSCNCKASNKTAQPGPAMNTASDIRPSSYRVPPGQNSSKM